MKRERLFYLDFIRAAAVLTILLCHFNARFTGFYLANPDYSRALGGTFGLLPFGRYIGEVGVALFFIISGAALMYVYQEKLELKTFFKKRFLSLYPMFWIAYVIGFLYFFYKYQTISTYGAPKPYIILTILGMDGYLSSLFPNYYILGEWFLGCIICFYLVFPLLQKLLRKSPAAFVIVTLVIYGGWTVFTRLHPVSFSNTIFEWLPEFAFGMIFVLYRKKVHPVTAVLAAIVLAVLQFYTPAFLPSSALNAIVGIALFLVLVWLSHLLDIRPVQNVCSTLSKYSYAIFLSHHVIIDQVCNQFDMTAIGKTDTLVLFLLCMALTAVAAKLLFMLHKAVMKAFRNAFAN